MIDTHLHVWQLRRGWYGWNTPAFGAVHADSSVDDIAAEMAGQGVEGVVLVQAADELAETDWLLTLAQEDRRVVGVVGYLPLADPEVLRRRLSAWAGAPLVGVRQLWHDHVQDDELGEQAVLASLGLLGESGLAVDVPDAHPRLWPALRTAVREVPQTSFVIDHCGKPPFGDRAAWSSWEDDVTSLAAHPNVVIKLSGLFGGSGSAVAATEQELARVVDIALDVAGPERTMIGSDWPMARGRVTYAETIARLDALLGPLSATERFAVTTGTAQTVYGLRSSRGSGTTTADESLRH